MYQVLMMPHSICPWESEALILVMHAWTDKICSFEMMWLIYCQSIFKGNAPKFFSQFLHSTIQYTSQLSFLTWFRIFRYDIYPSFRSLLISPIKSYFFSTDTASFRAKYTSFDSIWSIFYPKLFRFDVLIFRNYCKFLAFS